MVGMNVNKRIFPFFNSVKEPVSSAGTSNSFYINCLYDSLNLEVSGMTSGDLRVEGCINILKDDGVTAKSDDECSWTELAAIDLGSFSVLDKISENGIYSIATSGMNRVRVVINSISGNATIVGVAEA